MALRPVDRTRRLLLSLLTAGLLAVVAGLTLFPPWVYTASGQGMRPVYRPAPRSSIFSPPPPEGGSWNFGVEVDMERLGLEIAAILALGGTLAVLIFLLPISSARKAAPRSISPLGDEQAPAAKRSREPALEWLDSNQPDSVVPGQETEEGGRTDNTQPSSMRNFHAEELKDLLAASRMIRGLGYWWVFKGILSLVTGTVFVLYGAVELARTGELEDLLFGVLISIYGGVVTTVGVTAFKRPTWGRSLGLFWHGLILLGFPIGTIVGILGLRAYSMGGSALFGPERVTHEELASLSLGDRFPQG